MYRLMTMWSFCVMAFATGNPRVTEVSSPRDNAGRCVSMKVSLFSSWASFDLFCSTGTLVGAPGLSGFPPRETAGRLPDRMAGHLSLFDDTVGVHAGCLFVEWYARQSCWLFVRPNSSFNYAYKYVLASVGSFVSSVLRRLVTDLD